MDFQEVDLNTCNDESGSEDGCMDTSQASHSSVNTNVLFKGLDTPEQRELAKPKLDHDTMM